MMINRYRIVPLFLYLGMIFFLSSRPYLKAPGIDFLLADKIIHFVEYSILGVLLFSGIGRAILRSKVWSFLFLLAVGSSIGAMDEIFQSYIPGRHMSIYDHLADTLGVAAGRGLAFQWNAHRSSSSGKRPGLHSDRKAAS